VAVGQAATFTVAASGTAPLQYQWQRDGANIAGATSSSSTLASAAVSDNGATFRAVVTNSFGSATSNSATLTVTSNMAPQATITAPANGTLYRGGETFTFSGTGTDPEDGSLPPSAFTWRVDFHHDDHTHPFVPPTSGVTSGTFTIATRGETSANVFYRVVLTVRDSGGLTHTMTSDLRPRTTTITLNTSPAGLQLTLDGQPAATPLAVIGVEGVIRSIGAPSPQTAGGTTYQFASWSDGGAATHEITTPIDDTTYTATFSAVTSATLFSDDFVSNLGWVVNPGATDTATTGRWQRGNPQGTSSGGAAMQLDPCDANGASCLVTGLTAGSAVGANDVDGGTTSIQSPAITLPASGSVTLRFAYYFAHLNNSSSADFFRVRIVGTGSPVTVFEELGAATTDAASWVTRTVSLNAFLGQTIRIRVEAADAAAGSLVEAAVDTVRVTTP
jgi:hypothetical protein